MKSLVLAEKPSAAQEFARVLGCNNKGKGYFEGPLYVVTWALGHLATLKSPEDYGDKYKNWTPDTLPMIPEKLETKLIPGGAKKQFYNIKSVAERKDIGSLIIATDAGREGELVARLIMKHLGWKKPFKRLWISSLTQKSIKDGFNNLKAGQEYNNLFKAAKCRSEADWLIGLNVSRSLTIKYNDQLSAGRVQTPTLSMMVKREEEIKKFIPVPFWTIEGIFSGFKAQYIAKDNNPRIFQEDKAEKIRKDLTGKTARVKEIIKKQKRESPPLLYDLTELQREANNRYGFTAQKTLQVIQSLYEHHKIVTYPRTDSRYITEDMAPTMNTLIKALPSEYSKEVTEILKGNMKINKQVINNSKVTDHHALIPTDERVYMSKLSPEETKIYNLIIRRFLENFYPDFIYEQIKTGIDVGGQTFIAQGKRIISQGWKKVDSNINEETLPELREGQAFDKFTIELKRGETQPPSHYTEATLLTQMEKNNLGTPATRAQIIEKLININYVERKGRAMIPTNKGIQIVSIVEPELRSSELTARWEKDLEDITKGKKEREDFMKDIIFHTRKLVKQTFSSEKKYKHDNLLNIPCPECGKPLISKKKSNTLMHTCSDRNCKYKKVISKETEHRCSTCHKKMVIQETKGGMMYVCRKCNIHKKASDIKEEARVTTGDIVKLNKKMDEEFKKAVNPFAGLKDLFK